METKTLIAMFAVVCAFGALHASPATNQGIGLDASTVIERLQRVLAVIDARIKQVDDAVNEAIQRALDRVDSEATRLSDGWNDQIKELAKEADEQGVDIADCILLQQKLPEIVDNLRAEARKCVEENVKQVQDDVKDLESLSPVADRILEAAKEEATKCEEQSAVNEALCLGKLLAKSIGQAGGLARQALIKSGKVLAGAAAVGPRTAVCTSQTAGDRINSAVELVRETNQCINDKLQA